MLSISAIIAGFLALSCTAHGAPAFTSPHPNNNSSNSSINLVPGYKTVPMQWNLPIDPSAPDNSSSTNVVTVTGTIQEAIAQMEASHPGWNARFQAHLAAKNITAATPPKASVWSVDPESFKCYHGLAVLADSSKLQDGINYIRGLSGTAKNGPGPRNCGRISCSWDAAIWWCNDNTYEWEVEWDAIADGAQWVLERCRDRTIPKWDKASGEGWYGDGWGVLLKSDKC